MRKMIWFLLPALLISSTAFCKLYLVPTQYATIQAAINATNGPRDTVMVAAGRYREVLHINLKSITIIGAGRDHTVIHKSAADTAHIYISNSTVIMQGFELNGGDYNASQDYYVDATRRGIVCKDANLQLSRAWLNQYINYVITMHGGTLVIDDVYLYSRPYGLQCDVGIDLRGCVADIVRLHQEQGMIDHTIDIWGGIEGYGRSEVWVRDSKIAASLLTWGDCIRTYTTTTLEVHDCEFFRPAGGETPGNSHAGVSFMGYDVTAYIRRNTFTGLPWGMRILATNPSIGKCFIIFENNTVTQSILGGILIQGASYEIVDLGGGSLGSRGYNRFYNTAAFDVKLIDTTSDIYAHYNWWSYDVPDMNIWDWTDNHALGHVFTAIKPLYPLLLYPRHLYTTQSPRTKLIWRRSGGALIYDVQLSTSSTFRTKIFEQYGIPDTTADAGDLEPDVDYFWRVRAQNRWGVGDWSDTFSFHVIKGGTGVTATADAAWTTDISPVFPNPLNAEAMIRYSLSKPGSVEIGVYDLLGRRVQIVRAGMEPAGPHQVKWNAGALPSGIYLVMLSCADLCKTVKVTVVK